VSERHEIQGRVGRQVRQVYKIDKIRVEDLERQARYVKHVIWVEQPKHIKHEPSQKTLWYVEGKINFN
jgi:hypothetical protein